MRSLCRHTARWRSPFDADDKLSIQIAGLPSYEKITAPNGDTVKSAKQANGSYTWTVTEGASTTGTPLTELILSSSYTGSGLPVAELTVNASSAVSGQSATSVNQSMSVTDPPAGSSPNSPGAVTAMGPASVIQLAALFDQFVAAGFHNDQTAAGQMAILPQLHGGLFENLAALSSPHHSV